MTDRLADGGPGSLKSSDKIIAIRKSFHAARFFDPSAALPNGNSRNLGLDLMRSVSIVFVLLDHWGNNIYFWFGLGPEPESLQFLGLAAVECFFVLSGFLIGRLLLEIVQTAPTGRNLLIFLIRRWLRTLPLYYLWLGLLLVLFAPAGHAAEYGIRFGTITQNLFTPMPEDYFFAVSWSLGIEEWFYILFGTILVVGAMIMPARVAILGTIGLFLVVPPLLRLTVPGYSDWSTGLAKVTVFRLDEIAYGVLMAYLYVRRSWIFRYPLPIFCLAAFLLVRHKHLLPPAYFFPFIFTLIAGSFALCLPLFLRLQRAPGWLEAIIRRISAQSYCLYVIHLTLLVDVAQGLWWRHLVSAWTATAIALVSPFALSYLSFHFFESPLLALRPPQRLHKRARSPDFQPDSKIVTQHDGMHRENNADSREQQQRNM